MQALAAAIQALRVQRCVDVVGFRHRRHSVSRKAHLECLGCHSAAEEARSMSGCQCRRLVQEEQLGPTASPHDRAADIAPVQHADQPRPTGPAAFEQCASLHIVDDAPISSEEPSLGCRHDVAHGRDTILQRHDFKAETRVPRRSGCPGGGGLHK